MTHPQIIQGGMGVAVSDWNLARTVSCLGQLGVVSGTGIADVLARRLQLGDSGGHMRRALSHFPFPAIAEKFLAEYFIEGGKPAEKPFRQTPLVMVKSSPQALAANVLGSFAEVFLAKENHTGKIGINLLEKIQLPTLPLLFGAILAGVDYVFMGAGIPRSIPGVIDNLAAGKTAELKINVDGAAKDEQFLSRFDPQAFADGELPKLRRPRFIAIVSSATLAITLARKSNGEVDGFVVEGHQAGGHNAPPRGTPSFNDRGEPVYGERDFPELDKIRALGKPFWLAGNYGRPGKLREALDLGAAGIQVGTAFAFCNESGLRSDLKKRALKLASSGKSSIFLDPKLSPTGFPFKVASLPETLSEAKVFATRDRVCDLGALRQPYRKEDGTVGYRCPAEPAAAYTRKGGEADDLANRKCLCNGLFASAGFPQRRKDGAIEPPVVTAGDDFTRFPDFIPEGAESYSATDVVHELLAGQHS